MKDTKIQNPELLEAAKNELTEEELDEVSGGMEIDFGKKKEMLLSPSDLASNPAESLRKLQKNVNFK